MSEDLEEQLITEKEHSEFLEALLRALYGVGWDELTISVAKQCQIVRPK